MNKLWQTIESRERVRESISKHAQALPIGIRHSQQGKFRYEHGSPHSWEWLASIVCVAIPYHTQLNNLVKH